MCGIEHLVIPEGPHWDELGWEGRTRSGGRLICNWEGPVQEARLRSHQLGVVARGQGGRVGWRSRGRGSPTEEADKERRPSGLSGWWGKAWAVSWMALGCVVCHLVGRGVPDSYCPPELISWRLKLKIAKL